jgi:pimeloyl-ACP methyl ester carboxylesterase
LGNSRKQAPGWAAYEPDAQYVVIPNAGHHANQDNAPFFNALLLGFLRARVLDPGHAGQAA